MTRSEDRRRAVQGAWPRAVPLTRRERAAMAAALEVLRSEPLEAEPALTDALVVLGIAHDHGSALCGVIERAARWSRWPHAMWGMERRERLIRARLALYLRARLRADRGDCGPERQIDEAQTAECEECDGDGVIWAWTGAWEWRLCPACNGPHVLTRRITPWWQQPDMPEARR